MKDVEVLASPLYKHLRFGVPHGFLSPDLHFASDSVRHMPGSIPASLRFSKVYYVPSLKRIKTHEEVAQGLGDGAADEWHKGLLTQGKEAMADSARWEKWELQIPPGKPVSQVIREYDPSSFPRFVEETQSRLKQANVAQLPSAVNGSHPLPQPVHVFQNGYSTPFQSLHPQYSPQQFPFPHFPQQHFPRPIRNVQEVERAREARKAEIQRRCRELEPPLEPNVLQRMESFQAAIQITTPMTDAAWDVLQPRILAQREAAELVEHEKASQMALLQAALPVAVPDNTVVKMAVKPAKETCDREYEQAQEPLRKRLGEYADDCVNGHWAGGKDLKKDNAPIFAIQVLQHVARRYVEDKNLGLLPHYEAPKRKGATKQSTPPLEPFLSLDNMKWVYDNRVRPSTDIYHREHFICAGCAEEKKPKWFAFEGLIQHYAAKHTGGFSKGNIVVHWQSAEWPDEPPFHINPGQWLKGDRRVLDSNKAQARARYTPQGNTGGPFPAPVGTLALPEKPHHASSHSTASQGGPPSHFVSTAFQNASGAYAYNRSVPSKPRFDHEDQVNKLSSDAREIWDALDGVQDLETCIRVQTSIHHAVNRFVEKFQHSPPLDLLTDAFATNPQIRPLKNVHGVACRGCISSSQNAASGSYYIRVRGAKMYNTTSLITHYKLMHQIQDQVSYVDWTVAMMEPPDEQMITELLQAPGMDDDKLALIAAAFPTMLPMPLPKIRIVSAGPAETATSVPPASRLLDRLSKKPKKQSKKKGRGTSVTVADREDSQESLPEPGEDEYDPRRPIFIQRNSNVVDPSTLESDTRTPIVPPNGEMDLDPETLAVLQNLTAVGGQTQGTMQASRRSRSPSVGRIELQPADGVSALATAARPTGQPDIAAILASLTGQQDPSVVPTMSLPGDLPGSAIGASHQDTRAGKHYTRERPVASDVEERNAVDRYDTLKANNDTALQELQAALSNNHRRFEQNQHHTYAQPAYAPASFQAPPPRYQPAYEGEPRYSQPPHHVPAYQDAPVQYVQMPQDRGHAAHGYQYERPAPRTVYVDQYGRPLELIPIDTVPPVVQYTPKSYEQQYIRRQEPPTYPTMPPGEHYQPLYDVQRPVFYEQVSTEGQGVTQKFAYDNGRASVPRS